MEQTACNLPFGRYRLPLQTLLECGRTAHFPFSYPCSIHLKGGTPPYQAAPVLNADLDLINKGGSYRAQ